MGYGDVISDAISAICRGITHYEYSDNHRDQTIRTIASMIKLLQVVDGVAIGAQPMTQARAMAHARIRYREAQLAREPEMARGGHARQYRIEMEARADAHALNIFRERQQNQPEPVPEMPLRNIEDEDQR